MQQQSSCFKELHSFSDAAYMLYKLQQTHGQKKVLLNHIPLGNIEKATGLYDQLHAPYRVRTVLYSAILGNTDEFAKFRLTVTCEPLHCPAPHMLLCRATAAPTMEHKDHPEDASPAGS